MKQLRKPWPVFLVILSLLSTLTASAVTWGAWREFAKLSDSSGTVVAILSLRTKPDKDTSEYQWMLENTSAKTMYEVTINDADFIKSDNSKERMPNGYIGTIMPDKNRTQSEGYVSGCLKNVTFPISGAEVRFTYRNDGTGVQSWSKFGRVINCY